MKFGTPMEIRIAKTKRPTTRDGRIPLSFACPSSWGR
jgi:hypothetical protein